MDPRTTSRRTFLSLVAAAAGRRRGPRGLRQLRPHETGAGGGGGGGGGGGAGAGHLLVPVRAARSRRCERTPSSASTPPAPAPSRPPSSRTTPTRRRSRLRSGPARGPRSSGAGAAVASRRTSRRARSSTSTDWFRPNPDQKTRRFPSSFGAATVDGKIYALPARDRHADHLLLEQEGLRQGRRSQTAASRGPTS